MNFPNYRSSSSRSWGLIALGAGLAGLAGAGLGMLFAPRAGRQLRARLRDRADDASEALRGSGLAAAERLQRAVRRARDAFDQEYTALNNEVRNAVQTYRHEKDRLLARAEYDAIVDKTITKASRAKKWGEGQAKRLSERMKAEYAEVKARG